MKKYLFLFVMAIGFSILGMGQAILYEDFNYTPPAYIGGNGNAGSTSNNWTTHSVTAGQTTTVDIQSGSLSYTGLATSTGNKVYLFSNANAPSRDVNRPYTTTATAIYYSALVSVIDNSQISAATPDYFMCLGQTAGTTVTILSGRLGIKSVNTGANFRLSILNTSGGTPVFTEFAQDLTFGTTYLVVVKVDRSTTPITASLWVNPSSIGGTEPTGQITNNSGTGAFTGFASICLRNSATTPKANIDEIRVGTTWADVTPTGTVAPPTVQTSNFTFANVLQTQMDVSWTNGDGAKRVIKMNTTNSFTAPADGTDPTADPFYDSGEQVIYNGTGSTVPTVTGLTANTTYWFKAWEYNGSGSLTAYYTGVGANNPLSRVTAASATAPVIIDPTATSIGQISAVLGGNITADGGAAITERGTCWSENSPVGYNDHRQAEGSTATGVFTQTVSGFPANKLIYYAAYATNSQGHSLVESSFTTLPGEPTNHATLFTATSPTYSSVTNTWSDNNGAQAATGFLILANTTGIFTDPVDGVQPASDPSLTDGTGLVYVNPGVGTYTWYYLYASTPYYFAIYPYTNSGANIDYKTSAPVPNATVTTLPFVSPVAAWTFDTTPPSAAGPPVTETPTSVAAEFGDQIGTAYLYADGTNGSTLWNNTTSGNELTAFGGSTINDPRQGAAILAGMAYSPVAGTGLSANGKTMVIKFSMTALLDPILSFVTRGTTTGFNSQTWEWSTNGTVFTPFGSNTGDNTASFVLKTLDMSAINDLDGAAEVYLRVTFSGATNASGNNRLDNIVIRATPNTGPPATLSVSGTLLPGQSQCYNATSTITVAGYDLPATASATMIAGQNILYEPDTWIHAGAYMWGKIATSYCSKSPSMAEVTLPKEEPAAISLMDNDFRIYPNPTSGVFTLEQRGENVTGTVRVEVLNTLGGKILSSELQGLRKHELSIKGNPSGIYFVKIMAGEKVQTVKIILTN